MRSHEQKARLGGILCKHAVPDPVTADTPAFSPVTPVTAGASLPAAMSATLLAIGLALACAVRCKLEEEVGDAERDE